MPAGVPYSLVRLLLDVASTSRREQANLQAEVLVLRWQVQVLERQIRRVQWSPADRMILAALRERLPRTAWGALLVRPETVLGWHRDLVRRKWAKYGQRPRRGRPELTEEVALRRENRCSATITELVSSSDAFRAVATGLGQAREVSPMRGPGCPKQTWILYSNPEGPYQVHVLEHRPVF